MTSSESELTIDRLIAAPPSAVWDAWSTPAKLEKWWIPAPIACRVIALDLRPGGGFETPMRAGSGDLQTPIPACFLYVVPERGLLMPPVLPPGWQQDALRLHAPA